MKLIIAAACFLCTVRAGGDPLIDEDNLFVDPNYVLQHVLMYNDHRSTGYLTTAASEPGDSHICQLFFTGNNFTHFKLHPFQPYDCQGVHDLEFPPEDHELILLMSATDVDFSQSNKAKVKRGSCGSDRKKRETGEPSRKKKNTENQGRLKRETPDMWNMFLGMEEVPYADNHKQPYLRLMLVDGSTDEEVELMLRGDAYSSVYWDGEELVPEHSIEYKTGAFVGDPAKKKRNAEPIRKRRAEQDAAVDFESLISLDPRTMIYEGQLLFFEPAHMLGFNGFIGYPEPVDGDFAMISSFFLMVSYVNYGFIVGWLTDGDQGGFYPVNYDRSLNPGLCGAYFDIEYRNGPVDQFGVEMAEDLSVSLGWLDPPLGSGDVTTEEPPPDATFTPSSNATCEDVDQISRKFKNGGSRCENNKNADNWCNELIDVNGPFKDCYALVGVSSIDADRFHAKCRHAACLKNKKAACEVAEHFAELCQKEHMVSGNGTEPLELTWRSTSKLKCVLEKTNKASGAYIQCVHPSEQRTCHRPTGCSGFTESAHCVEMAKCTRDSEFWNGKKCVDKC